MSTQNLTQKPQARNGQSTLATLQFVVAFCPTTQPNNLTQLWSARASDAIGVLIDFTDELVELAVAVLCGGQ